MIEASGVPQFHRIDDAGGHYGKCQTMKPPPPYKQRPARDIVKLTATVDASTTGSERGRGSRWPAARTAVGKWEKLSRDLDEAVGVLPATRLENDPRDRGTAEDANGNTLSPGLDRSRD